MNLDTKIEELPRTQTQTIKKFKSLGINTFFDLLNYFPNRYENYSILSKINNVQEGETVTIIGKVIEGKYQITRTGLKIQAFKIQDETGIISTGFFNQPYLLKLFKVGLTIAISGTIKIFGKKITIEPKEYEIANNFPLFKHTGRIIPIYSERFGLSSKTIREKIFYLTYDRGIDKMIDPLIKEIINSNNLIEEAQAYKEIHFPTSIENIELAKKRLSFDELFLIQLSNKLVKNQWKKEIVGNQFIVNKKNQFLLDTFINNLPFKLTQAQLRVWDEIQHDLIKTHPMNRFLQGEVGSGKTVIAALACYLSYLNGYQSLIMAPTEILANQHYKTLSLLFEKYKINVGLITGSINKQKLKQSKYDLVIGTHALLNKNNNYDKLGLVIIDEQHRFGVAQRATLKEKGINPHLLTMTATPIPRTVALTLYGELDISIINEMPKNRIEIKSFFIPKNKREKCYQWIKKQIKEFGDQVFIVCPLIEESDTETMKSVKAATTEFDFLKKVFPEFKLGLLHGKLKSDEKNSIMSDFKNKKYHILVSTPVVEVGIDIPNATIMIIEGGERFGLASLHQLRGRVGRGNKQSYCFVFSEKEDTHIIDRLSFFAKTKNGNILAEHDLKTRGAGNIFGFKQHGFIDLKIADLSDYKQIEDTKKAVNYFNEKFSINKFPQLKKRLAPYKTNLISKD